LEAVIFDTTNPDEVARPLERFVARAIAKPVLAPIYQTSVGIVAGLVCRAATVTETVGV
jgi:hypothetical protein